MGKNVTMKDIANQLNVSTVTVSKALSDREGVSDAVRNQIKQKADEMGYRYNAAAKSIKNGLNYNIGILVAEQFMHDSAFYSKMYQKLMKYLMSLDYFGILEVISEEAENEGFMPHVIQNNKIDGVIILGQMSNIFLEKIAAAGIPYVFLDFCNEHFRTDSIISDNYYGAYEITNYLISLGHKNIGFVGNRNATNSIMDRYIGYYKALLQNKLPVIEDWVISDRDERGKFCELKLPDSMPTAFVCNCDEIAYYFILELKKAGFKVPQDISVTGFDNSIHSALSDPAITTVEVNVDAMAETAVSSIIRKLRSPDQEYGRKVISGRIIIRESAARRASK